MSTVEDEADLGPEENTSDDGSDSTIQSNVQHEHEEDIYAESRIPQILQEAREGENEGIHESSRARAKPGHNTVKSISEDESENGLEVLPNLTGERLSSADGSVSMPDDTPSIQVRL